MSEFQIGLSKLRLPPFHRVRQHFPTPEVADVAAAVRAAVAAPGIAARLRPGLVVGVAVGSRGIAGVAGIVATLVAALKARGCQVRLIPAMGSHGGGTVEGQAGVLAGYGVTAEAMGAPIVNSLATRQVGGLRFDGASADYLADAAGEFPVPMSADALDCDLVVPVVRVKPHTGFRAPYESGICKMLAIGLGKHDGCSRYHREGYGRFPALIPAAAKAVLATGRIGFALALVENAAERTALVEAVPAEDILRREPELLAEARRLMPRLLLPAFDVLVVERIGKEISGTGMDTNIIGRSETGGGLAGGPEIRRIVVLGLSEATHGNAAGLGLADLTTERAVAAIDRRVTYTNVLTSGSLPAGKIPVSLPDDDTAILAATTFLPGTKPADATIVRIRDTLHLEEILVSQNLLPLVGRTAGMEPVGAA
jgi:hypothetical protein